MDRKIVYAGQIPLDTDLLTLNKGAYVGLAKLAAAALGINGVVNGMAVSPTSPASLNVSVAPGEVYMMENLDNTAYGGLASDTTHQILKQGILMDAATPLSCPAPATPGQSINYLIQVAFSETDTGSVALPYYNASNPSVAWSGPGNTGTPQATVRSNAAVVTVKPGAAATTGSQTTPSPDAGNFGLAVVTVANGQATITGANIVQYPGAPLVSSDGLLSNAMHALYIKNVAGNADVTLTAQEAAYPMLVLIGTLTGNINVIVPATTTRQRLVQNNTAGAFSVTVKTAAGTGVSIPQGLAMDTYCDGTNVYDGNSSKITQSTADARYSPIGSTPVTGSFRNLKASANGISANISVSADELVLENGSDVYQKVNSVNVTINSAGSGANGLDTGTLSASAWYAVWIIWNGSTIAGLLSTSATAPTLPGGYTHKARVGWIRTDASGSKFPLSFTQNGRKVQYTVSAGSNVAALPIMVSGVQGSTTTPTWVATAIANYVPSTASEISVVSRDAGGSVSMAAPNNSYGAASSATNPPPLVNEPISSGFLSIKEDWLIEGANVYFASSGSTGMLACMGWEDNL